MMPPVKDLFESNRIRHTKTNTPNHVEQIETIIPVEKTSSTNDHVPGKQIVYYFVFHECIHGKNIRFEQNHSSIVNNQPILDLRFIQTPTCFIDSIFISITTSTSFQHRISILSSPMRLEPYRIFDRCIVAFKTWL